METIFMKCQILFSRKNKNIISLSSAEFAQVGGKVLQDMQLMGERGWGVYISISSIFSL